MRVRSAECGVRSRAGEVARPLRTPHPALRTCLLLALAACGRSDGPRVTVTIPLGASLEAAVDSLAANRVIDHPGLFRTYAKLRGLAGSLKSGVYLDRKSVV